MNVIARADKVDRKRCLADTRLPLNDDLRSRNPSPAMRMRSFQDLIAAYYDSPPEDRDSLARRFGLTTAALYSRIAHVRKQLRPRVQAELGDTYLPPGPYSFDLEFSRAMRRLGPQDQNLDVVGYYRSHRPEIDLLADQRGLFVLALIRRLGPIKVDDIAHHAGFDIDAIADVCERLGRDSFAETGRETQLVHILLPGQKLLALIGL